LQRNPQVVQNVHIMSTDEKFKELLENLVKVGVGGKYKNHADYVKLITQELEFEEQMIRGGVERYNKSINDAKAKGQESTTLYGIVFGQKYIKALSGLIDNDVKTCMSGTAGVKQTSLKLLCQCLSKRHFNEGIFLDNSSDIWRVVSYISIKNVIDGISRAVTINELAMNISNALMMEARITLFNDKMPDKYEQVQRKLNSQSSKIDKNKYRYKRNVWVYFMNKNKLDFDDWKSADKLHLGVKVIEYFEKLGLVTHENRRTAKNRTVCFIVATDKLLEEIKNFNIRNEALHPTFLPMLMPPMDWTSPFSGGYYGRKYNQTNKPEDIANALQLRKKHK
jgi:DNA-directed RNA polymerase